MFSLFLSLIEIERGRVKEKERESSSRLWRLAIAYNMLIEFFMHYLKMKLTEFFFFDIFFAVIVIMNI